MCFGVNYNGGDKSGLVINILLHSNKNFLTASLIKDNQKLRLSHLPHTAWCIIYYFCERCSVPQKTYKQPYIIRYIIIAAFKTVVKYKIQL